MESIRRICESGHVQISVWPSRSISPWSTMWSQTYEQTSDGPILIIGPIEGTDPQVLI